MSEKPWRDEGLMRELYHEERMSQQEIADHFDNDITQATIGYWLDKLEIEKRSRAEAAKIRWLNEQPCFRTDDNGYELVETWLGEDLSKVLHHRLLAIHKYGYDEVCGKVVHHKNDVPWDNRPDNIELMSAAEHAMHHHHSSGTTAESD